MGIQCICGNHFMSDAVYCRKCGRKRPHVRVMDHPVVQEKNWSPQVERTCMDDILAMRQQVREQKRLQHRWKDEIARLRLLVGLGQEQRRCHRCDLGIAHLRQVLRALRTVLAATYDAPRAQGGSLASRREMLKDVGVAVESTSHLDPRLAELTSQISIVHARSAPRAKK